MHICFRIPPKRNHACGTSFDDNPNEKDLDKAAITKDGKYLDYMSDFSSASEKKSEIFHSDRSLPSSFLISYTNKNYNRDVNTDSISRQDSAYVSTNSINRVRAGPAYQS